MSDSEDVVSPADSAAQKLDECTDPRLYVLSSTLQTAVKNLEDNLNNTLTSQLHRIESGLDKRFTDLFSKYDSLVSTREDHNVIPSVTGNPVGEPLMLQHMGATSDENGDPRVTHNEDIERTPEDLPADNEDEISLYTSEAEETLNSLLGRLRREPSPESEPPVTDESLHEQLKKYYEEFENNEPVGNPINEKLADFVNHTWHNRLTTDSMKNRLNKVLVPGNIDNDNRQVNKEIFQMPGSSMSRVRSNDIELQSIVKTLVKAMCPIIYHADKCYEANSTKPATQISNSETIGACMDTLFLVQHAINQIDDYRREKYKPELPGVLKKLSKEPQGKSTLLFGDNLEVRIKEIKDASAVEQELVTEKFKKRKFDSSNNSQNKTLKDANTTRAPNWDSTKYDKAYHHQTYKTRDSYNQLPSKRSKPGGAYNTEYNSREKDDLANHHSRPKNFSSSFRGSSRGKRPRVTWGNKGRY